ncbi:hypothetical protein SBV1_370010 [Verrucomicrobia bacterium]|nr:hypothetical protein SBV1_370010 [Verrucomicrobiota bacterium]
MELEELLAAFRGGDPATVRDPGEEAVHFYKEAAGGGESSAG